MKKILVVLIASMALVSCGNNKKTPTPTPNTDIVTSTSITNTTSAGEESSTTTTSSVTTTTKDSPAVIGVPKATPAVQSTSGVIGHISIPSIGLDWNIYEGIDLSVLNNGPGHYSHSPKPCRSGNAAIAGHRTTHGAPFNKLDLLKAGDIVNITTPAGDCTYKYLRTEIVSPTNIAVVMPKDGNANLLTLTACHPKGSAAQRITVTFSLVNVTVH